MFEWLPKAVFPQYLPSRKESFTKKDPQDCASVPYIQSISKAVARTLSDLNVEVHMKPMPTVKSILSQLKDRVPEADKSNVYEIDIESYYILLEDG